MKKFTLACFILTIINVNSFSQSIGLVDIRNSQTTITVGGADADIAGFTSGAIQIALDAVKSRGGGIVKLNPGVYEIIGPVRVPDNTTLTGSGNGTVLHKCDGFRTSFTIDADWGMLKAVVKDASGFKKGMGIQLYDDKNNDGWEVTTAMITDIKDNVIYFDNATVNDYIASLNGTVSNGCSIIEAVGVKNTKISDLKIEGNKSTNDLVNGCRGGGIYVHRSKDCLIENVTINEFNGDTYSFQITENVTARNCVAMNGAGLGFHPGTGSDRPVIENCVSHGNASDGIFLCWRVQNGVFRNNTVYSNGGQGISIGHKDTDNIFENNHIYENSAHGVYFRDENEQNSGHRNVFTGNIIENNGTKSQSCGFYIGGETHDITIKNNTISSNGKGNQPVAIFVGKKSSNVTALDNKISGAKAMVQEK